MAFMFSIRKDQEVLGYIYKDKDRYNNIVYVTEGTIGENSYNSIEELIYGLQGFDIAIDNFFT